ncbi:MAG: DHH family phosphoesterase [Chloroflexi bacterium]|nr:DHH family phosphoesterase [Chloroflexota bacterium]
MKAALVPAASRRTPAARHRLASLLQAVADVRRLLIVSHDNPDPDALATAYALQTLVRDRMACSTTLAFGGIVGRAENRAMIARLGLDIKPLAALQLQEFDGIVLVDTQPGAGNHSLPLDAAWRVVLDHHPLRQETRSVPHFDVRPGYGATTTIAVEYLETAGSPINRSLATALLYGLKSETLDLGRMAGRADVRAYRRLYPLADVRLLATIQRPRLARVYFADLQEALARTIVCGPVGRSSLPTPAYPDMVAEVADLLLRLEGLEWAVCFGWYDGCLLISVRTSRDDVDAGAVIRAVVGARGSAGGHDVMAGARIPNAPPDAAGRAALEADLWSAFLEILGVQATGYPLLAPADS